MSQPPKPKRASPDRKKTWRPNFVDHRTIGNGPKKWDPEKAAKFPAYPKTEEAYEAQQAAARERIKKLVAEGRWGRKGVPDGWSGKREEVAVIREVSQTFGERAARKMIEDDVVAPVNDGGRAEAALAYAIGIVRSKTESTKERLTAAKLVLDFTKQRPATRSDVTVKTAEDFLTEIATAL